MKPKKREIKDKMSPLAKISFGVFLILILIFMFNDYSNNYNTRINLQNILKNPEKYSGILYQTSGRISEIKGDFIYILDTEANIEVPVLYTNHLLKKGDNLVVYGPISGGGYITAAKVRLQNSEPFKYIISLLAGIVFLIIFLREWRLTWRGFEEVNYA